MSSSFVWRNKNLISSIIEISLCICKPKSAQRDFQHLHHHQLLTPGYLSTTSNMLEMLLGCAEQYELNTNNISS